MIEGDKVVITAMTREALPLTLEWVNDPEYKYYNGTIFPISEFEHFSYFENKAKEKYDKVFLIREKSSMKCIGMTGFKNMDVINGNTEMYCSLGKSFGDAKNVYGQGYGTEAILLMSGFAFHELNLHKVYAKVYAYNGRSKKAFEKAGFVVEAVLKEHHFTRGEYTDIFLMRKLENEAG